MSGALVVALGVAAVVAGCGGDDGEQLTVYSGRHYGIETAFEEWSDETGIDVEFLTGNDAELRERIAAEGEDTEADVYLTVDAGNLWAAAEDDLFQPLDSTVLDESIPEQLRDPDNRWFGLAVRARTIVYNTDLIDEADVPTTYEELAEPEWEGRICLRNANNDYQQSLVASMIAADGEEATVETLRGWAANADIYANDVELLEAMAAGACEVGVVNHYYLARLLEDDPTRRSASCGPSRTLAGCTSTSPAAASPATPTTSRSASSSSSGWRPTGRTRSSPTTTSTRPTRASRPSR